MVEPKIQERQGPHGNVEIVPTRTSVTSHIPAQTFTRANQDEFTEKRRAHYGEDNRYSAPVKPENHEIVSVPNDVDTPNNPTRDKQIRLPFRQTSYGMSMCQ